jgi:ferredoxin
LKPSTISILKKHGWRVDRFVHHYIYFVFYQPYIKIAVFCIEPLKHLTWFKPIIPAIRAIYERFHAKFITLEDTRKILSLNEDIVAVSEKNKRIIPFRYAYKIIFQEPDCLAVMDCPCKKALPPYESVNCCIAVGRELASFWLEHCTKYNARKISQDEALEIVTGFRKTGHVTQAFFKVATGGSTGVICNCRPESCISLKASVITGRFQQGLVQTAVSGYSVRLDPDKCSLCGLCLENCYPGALLLNNGKMEYRREVCFGCGLCVDVCPENAVTLYQDQDKPLPLDVDLVRKEFLGSTN